MTGISFTWSEAAKWLLFLDLFKVSSLVQVILHHYYFVWLAQSHQNDYLFLVNWLLIFLTCSKSAKWLLFFLLVQCGKQLSMCHLKHTAIKVQI